MKRKFLFSRKGKQWNKFLRKFKNLYKRITNGSNTKQQERRLKAKLNRTYQRLEKMQYRVGVKLAGTAIVIMMLSATSFAQNTIPLGYLKADSQENFGTYIKPSFKDIDGDNDLDLFVGELNGKIKVFTNDGNNNFTSTGYLQADGSDIDVGNQSAPVFADINGDNNFDLFIGEDSGYIKVFTNDGNNNFTETGNLQANNYDVHVSSHSTPIFADVDGDDDLDLFIGEETGYVNVFINDGNGNFTGSGNLLAGGSDINVGEDSAPVFVDIDGDNDLDLYVGENSGYINVFTNDGNNNFTSTGYLQADGSDIDVGNKSAPVFADIDGDSDFDLYIGDRYGHVNVFENDGNGNFTETDKFNADNSNIDSGSTSAIAFADIDEDSDLDLYVGDWYGYIQVFINDGTNNFTSIGNLQANGFDIHVDYHSVPVFADIDGDNDLDLYVGEIAGYINVFLNDGEGDFTAAGNMQSNGSDINIGVFSAPVFADIDEDSDLDLYVGENYGSIKIFTNDGNGHFIPAENMQADGVNIDVGDGSSPIFYDVDGDNDLDLYVGNDLGNIMAFTNDGNGNFSVAGNLQSNGYNIDVGSSAAPTFANLDGSLKLFVGNQEGNILVYQEIEAVGINEIRKTNISIYPNPTTGIFTVKTEANFDITITNISGKVISQIPNFTNSKLDLSNQPNGIYFIKFQNSEFTETLKIIKQ